ncbi:MAG: ACP S-malonyltransferase [Rhodothalassiaceae bacterium]
MSVAWIFPGQGSQAVGMGQALAEAYAEAREVFQEVDEAVSQHLFRLMREGPEEDLRLTENAQPALMAVSLAVVRVLAAGGHRVETVTSHLAGHSLGEYTALAAAGSLSLSDAARLLKRRGQAMQRAVPVGQGAMAAILGLDFDTVEEIAEAAAQMGVCACANDNAPGQVVLSGDTAALDRAIALAKEQGAKRAMPLPVSAPFHCALMQPAAEDMAEALSQVVLSAPVVPIISNVTAHPVTEPEQIRELLVAQVTHMVRWRETVAQFRGWGIEQVAELGSGKVLAGLVKRIDRDLAITSVGTPEEVEAYAATI